jgi:hypothetical protein
MARGMEGEEPPETGDWAEAAWGKVLPDGGRRRVMLDLGWMGQGAIIGQRNTEREGRINVSIFVYTRITSTSTYYYH